MNYRQFQGIALIERGRIKIEKGDLSGAEKDLRSALEIALQLHANFDLTRASLYLAALLSTQKKSDANMFWPQVVQLILDHGYDFLIEQERSLVIPWIANTLDSENPLLSKTSATLFEVLMRVPPPPLQAFLGRLADSSIALGLITVGAALRLDGTPGVRGISLWLLAVKLLALPLIAAVAGRLLGLDGLNYQVVVLFAALPTASSAYILAMRMGGDGRSVAWLISATTLGSMLTLPFWAAWLMR